MRFSAIYKNTLSEKTRKILNYGDIIVFFIILVFKLITYGKEISPEYFDSSVITPIIASVLIIFSFSFLFKGKKRTAYLLIIDLIISLILISDIAYFRYNKDIITVSAVQTAKLLVGVKSSVADVLSIKDFMFLLDIIILVPTFIYVKSINKNTIKLKFRLVLFLAVFIFGAALDAQQFHKVNVEQPTLLTAMSNRIYLTKMIGNLNFHVVDAYNFTSTKVKNSKKLPEARKNAINNYLKNNNSIPGVKFKSEGSGKNLIMIQVEALQGFVVNKSINGKEITPNLNKWINKSLYFDNYFYQVAQGNTSDAEFMSLNSLYPAQSGAAYYTYAGNTFNSIPKDLGDKGYYTAALHGYNEGFWNRNVMYKSEKFDDFYGQTSYKNDEVVGMGLSDESFLNQSLAKMKTFKQPYFSFLITLSSHYPFNDTAGYEKYTMNKLDVGEYKDTLLGNYFEGIHYTDEQLGKFLDKLDKEGLTKNSIIVLYGDHFAIPKENINQLYSFEGIKDPTDLTWYEYQKVPMFIHFPDDEHKGVNHTYSGQMDIYPTIANLYNISNNYMFGEDILNVKDGDSTNVTFRNGSFTDGKIFYVSWTNTYYDIATGKKIKETPELNKKKEAATTELEYSDDLLNHNLIKTFLK
ncbi:phosphoglycerol transferase MdoB-like AlkP superfamily enzyme [Clostridium acetobutylicum]|uniref:Alkaline phosphatase superfamily enzyme n=1 Tax=Clostridium acetobutylicum (strain ATCC 824 / DSM 792 / JCM 1419 / IAM 19013 / LMG 5710 / NBRC 13948 / NRRL B-527 / VKM B-1787 / 2291 / W) TaxID=272562 RepID=Q97GD7_CLOAB|nr:MULTISPECIES: LTA synthase family protein [Clostridium]AAK80385.1 Alkaline phosphatase superfamily enzyme [Clostridium acetobutylicum ATCC 824]ADZ21482.1 Alkaline phosphatase superfamily enzyme [Clostridium acetobutylicum EA 2018]AEI33621.1 alkaline phosphatase [Clostridium acetobutylicum DSM 1731]AWV79196.1 LTA synthase family protein [Clostridium acetobutylicum]MBC2394839.1 LTA synthase family protein [Clostridium acetobutylicum]